MKKKNIPNVSFRLPFVKRRFKPADLLAVIAVFGVIGTLMIGLGFVAPNTRLYLNPASKTVIQDTSFGVAVRVDTGGEEVNAVQANLTYPADRLEFVSIDPAGSAFEITAQSVGGNGSIKISRGTLTPVTGDKLIATVNFKALSGDGSAEVVFASGSAVSRYSDSTDVMNGTDGGTYSFSLQRVDTPTETPPDATSPQEPATSSPSSSGSTTPQASGSDTSAPADTPPSSTTSTEIPSGTSPTTDTDEDDQMSVNGSDTRGLLIKIPLALLGLLGVGLLVSRLIPFLRQRNSVTPPNAALPYSATIEPSNTNMQPKVTPGVTIGPDKPNMT